MITGQVKLCNNMEAIKCFNRAMNELEFAWICSRDVMLLMESL